MTIGYDDSFANPNSVIISDIHIILLAPRNSDLWYQVSGRDLIWDALRTLLMFSTDIVTITL